MKNFNQLTPAEAERLAFLAEECGELIQAIGKVLRHGYDNYNPLLEDDSPDNRRNMVKEMGDVRAAMLLMCNAADVRLEDIIFNADIKLTTIDQWMHHQGKKDGSSR